MWELLGESEQDRKKASTNFLQKEMNERSNKPNPSTRACWLVYFLRINLPVLTNHRHHRHRILLSAGEFAQFPCL